MVPKLLPARGYGVVLGYRVTLGYQVVLAALLLTLAVPASAQDAPPAPKVVVSKPIAKQIPRWDEFTGRFEPMEQVEIRPRVSGFIDQIHFKDGQMVQKDDVLFTIDPTAVPDCLRLGEGRRDEGQGPGGVRLRRLRAWRAACGVAHRAGEGAGSAARQPGHRDGDRAVGRCGVAQRRA